MPLYDQIRLLLHFRWISTDQRPGRLSQRNPTLQGSHAHLAKNKRLPAECAAGILRLAEFEYQLGDVGSMTMVGSRDQPTSLMWKDDSGK